MCHSAGEQHVGKAEDQADNGGLIHQMAKLLPPLPPPPPHQKHIVLTSISSCLLQQQQDFASAEYSMSTCPGSDTMAALLPLLPAAAGAAAAIAARMLAETGSTGCLV